MKYPLNRYEVSKSIFFNSIIDKRFKTNRISVNLISLLDDNTVSANAIIPFILKNGFKDFPDLTLFNQKLEEMYGAIFDVDVIKMGNYQILSFYISSIDSKYAFDNEDMVKEIADLICGVILNPVLENECFLQKSIDIEKQFLIDAIQSEVNDKKTYASNKMKSQMFKGMPCGINKYGSSEDIKLLDGKSITERYHDLLKHSRIEIMFVGCGDADRALNIFKNMFGGIERNNQLDIINQPKQPSVNTEEFVENIDVKQSKLVLGFSTGIPLDSEEMVALRLGVVLYGGMPFSKLFLNVREAMSLCYYCSAKLDKLNGSIVVESGVEKANIDKAKDEIIRQLELMQKGQFTEEEILHAKLALTNSFKSVNDSPGMVEVWYLSQIFSGLSNTPYDDIEKINKVTKQQIIEVMNKLHLDVSYVLTDNEVNN